MRFIYNNKTISIDHPSHEIVDGQYRTKIIRNLEFEKAALDVTKPFRAFELGEREVNGNGVILEKNFIPLVEAALGQKWEVIAHQKPVRAAHDFDIQIKAVLIGLTYRQSFGSAISNSLCRSFFLNLNRMNDLFRSAMELTEYYPRRCSPQFGTSRRTRERDKCRIAIQPRASVIDGFRYTDPCELICRSKIYDPVPTRSQLKKSLSRWSPVKTLKVHFAPIKKWGSAGWNALTSNEIGGILADDMGLGKTIQILALLSRQISKGPDPDCSLPKA